VYCGKGAAEANFSVGVDDLLFDITLEKN